MAANEARVEALFNEARAIPSPEERAAFLNRGCAGDDALRARVEELLSANDLTGDVLDRPPQAAVMGTAEYVEPRERIGSVVAGKYKLLQQIGRGGMGVVYMARQTEPIRREVAVKIIQPGMDSQQVLARFEAERQALAMLDHPNVARVFDAGTTEQGQPFFVMELIKGVPITQFCDENRLPVRERLNLFVDVCHAIQHAHQKGIIHRDVKPSNVLVAMYDDRPIPKIIDFGVAKATTQPLTERTLFTQYGAIVGTLEYMSPEQAKFNALDIDTRTDVYALGVLLYELLTGSTPIERKRLRSAAFDEMLRIIREEEPPAPSRRLSSTHELPSIAAQRGLEPRRLGSLIRGELDWIVMKCLEKDRGRRYETASSLALDVSRYLADEPVLAGPPSAAYRLRKFVRRRKGAVAAAAGIVVLALVGLALQAWQLQREVALRKTAQEKTQEALDAKALESQARNDAERAKKETESVNKDLEAQKKVAVDERMKADAARKHAESERDAKNLAFIRADGLRLASESNAVRESDPGLAVLLGIEAVQRYQHPLTFNALFEAKSASREIGVLDASDVGGAYHLKFLSNGKRLLSAGKAPQRGSAAIWNLETWKRDVVWDGFQLPVTDMTVRKDERRIACAVSGYATLYYGEKVNPSSLTFTDRVAYIWDAATGRDVVHCRGHEDNIVSVEFSPDGSKLLTASADQTARLFDAETGATLHIFKGHENSLRRAFFSPDGKRIVTLTRAQLSSNWGRKPDVPVQPVPANVDPGIVDRPILSRSSGMGSFYVSRKLEKAFARIWDVDTGKEVGQLLGDAPGFFTASTMGDTQAAAWSPDGKSIAVSFSSGLIGYWPATGGEMTRSNVRHQGGANALAFTKDGALCSGGEDAKLNWFMPADKDRLRFSVALGSRPIQWLIPSPTETVVLAILADGPARLVNQALHVESLTGHREKILAAAYRQDGSALATGDDREIRLWTTRPASPVAAESRVHGAEITAFVVSHSGKLLATGSRDATVQVWDLETGSQRWSSTPCRGRIRGLSFSSDDRTLFAATGLRRDKDAKPLSTVAAVQSALVPGSGSTAPYWDVETGKSIGGLPTGEYGSRTVVPGATGRALVIGDGESQTAKNEFFAMTVTTSGTISGGGSRQLLVDAAIGKEIAALPTTASETANPLFTPDGKSFLVIVDQGRIGQHSSATGVREGEYRPGEGLAQYATIHFSPSGEFLLAPAAWTPTQIFVWRTTDRKLLEPILLNGSLRLLRFHPDGKRMLTCIGRIPALRTIPDGKEVASYTGHELDVTCAEFSSDGKFLLTGSEDRSAALWESDTGKLICMYRNHPGPVKHGAFVGKDRIVTASTDGVLRLWTRDILEQIRGGVHRRFTLAEQLRYDLPAPNGR